MTTPDITIKKRNETFMKVTCKEKGMELDIQERFSFKSQNFNYDPRVQSGKWDGYIKLYNRVSKTLYVGLLFELLSFCEKRGYTYTLDDKLKPSDSVIDGSDVINLVDNMILPHSNGKPIELYDYQIEAVTHMLNSGRSTILAATSAGKSLILYTLIRIYQMLDEFDDRKIVICVPSSSLVEQLYNDFADYSSNDKHWNVVSNCQKISAKYTKYLNKQIVITTWQSAANFPPHLLNDEAGAIIVDECHTAKAKVLSNILESSTEVAIRHGVTGTLDDFEAHELIIQGLFGPKEQIISAHELMDKGRATKIKVQVIVLKHPEQKRQELWEAKNKLTKSEKVKKYNLEIDYLNSCKPRNEFIFKMAEEYKGNTIVLFDKVEKYGKLLYEEMSQYHKNSFYITGDVSIDDREDIRRCIEQYDDGIIFASYGTCQQGISIKKLNNMILASSSKSKIRVLQSIGRIMRLHESKQYGYVLDIVDDLSYNNDPNYVLLQAKERMEYYTNEKYDVEFLEINLK